MTADQWIAGYRSAVTREEPVAGRSTVPSASVAGPADGFVHPARRCGGVASGGERIAVTVTDGMTVV